ncbi:MAG: hypothetical protein LBS30_07445, partial [Planctomycetota bacterium]|nr:hypothetical protein [Planctomycetota bacterium]
QSAKKNDGQLIAALQNVNDSNRVNAVMFMGMETNIQTHAPIPTHQEVCDFALVLAIDAGPEGRARLALLHRPENASPPAGETSACKWAMAYREQARLALTRRMDPGEPESICERSPVPLVVKRRRKTRYPPSPVPTWAEVVEFAKVLAFDEGDVNRNCLRLIEWTSDEQLKMTGKAFAKHLPTALAYRDKARRLLTERMELDHRRRLRRLHREKRRKKQRGRQWLRWPLRRPQNATSPRHRGIPLWLTARATAALRSHSPPDRLLPASPSVQRSYECRREELLCCAGGGHRPGALRQRTLWNPLPQCGTAFIDKRIVFHSLPHALRRRHGGVP